MRNEAEIMDNPLDELRTTYRWDDDMDMWSDSLPVSELVAGDIFYMIEPDGVTLVTDSEGYTVFVATKAPQPRTDNPSRWKIDSVPVAPQSTKGDA